MDGFTKKYGIKKLVYFEQHDNAESTIYREKRLKGWRWEWKLKLIERSNFDWNDSYDNIL